MSRGRLTQVVNRGHLGLEASRVMCLGLLVTLSIAACSTRDSQSMSTADAERAIAQTHEPEVRSAIQKFEAQWLSLEAHQDPRLQSDLATGPYLDQSGYARLGERLYDEPFWLVTKSASVRKIEVLEYATERFKAVACVARVIEETSTQGTVAGSPWIYRSRRVYVFVRESDEWKLAALFDISIPNDVARDWDALPHWMREIVGAVPEEMDPGCLAGTD